ncbi:MAG TPA: hypothetical protein VGD98_07755 [Ktedonobacteraceae bacterium]
MPEEIPWNSSVYPEKSSLRVSRETGVLPALNLPQRGTPQSYRGFPGQPLVPADVSRIPTQPLRTNQRLTRPEQSWQSAQISRQTPLFAQITTPALQGSNAYFTHPEPALPPWNTRPLWPIAQPTPAQLAPSPQHPQLTRPLWPIAQPAPTQLVPPAQHSQSTRISPPAQHSQSTWLPWPVAQPAPTRLAPPAQHPQSTRPLWSTAQPTPARLAPPARLAAPVPPSRLTASTQLARSISALPNQPYSLTSLSTPPLTYTSEPRSAIQPMFLQQPARTGDYTTPLPYNTYVNTPYQLSSRSKLTRPKHYTLPLTAILLLFLVAIVISGLVTVQQQVQATSATSKLPYPPYKGTLLLNDPLHNNSTLSSWEVGSNSAGTCDFEADAYHVRATRRAAFTYCQTQSLLPGNFAIQVKMTILAGDRGGLVFRSKQLAGYFFSLDRKGLYSLTTFTSSGSATLLSGISPAITKGQTYLLAVVVINQRIDLYVNQQHIASKTNATLKSGAIALGTQDLTQPTNVMFSDIEVWQV